MLKYWSLLEKGRDTSPKEIKRLKKVWWKRYSYAAYRMSEPQLKRRKISDIVERKRRTKILMRDQFMK